MVYRLDLTADQYPYDASSTTLTAILPDKFVKSGGVKEEYKTQKGREEIKAVLSEVFDSHNPENIMISVFRRNSAFEGENLREIAEMLGHGAPRPYGRIKESGVESAVS